MNDSEDSALADFGDERNMSGKFSVDGLARR